MKKEDNKLESFSIYIQAVIAMLFINFIHKLVREIPGSQIQLKEQSTLGGIITIGMAIILVISITLLFLKREVGLYLGIIPAIWAIIQWIFVHVILGYPDINGIWWYPIFPVIQGLLIIYFSYLAWKNEERFK